MKRSSVWLLVTMVAISIAAVVAFASSVHLKGGANAEPAFTDNGLTLTAAGELAGLGGGDVVVSMTAKGNPTATCTNPAGATQPPGHNPAEVTLTGEDRIPQSEIQNGNTPFTV